MAGTRNQNKLLQQRKQRNKITHTKKEDEKEKKEWRDEGNKEEIGVHTWK
jgi:hypothetical protein